MSKSYQKWWKAFRTLGKIYGRGWQKELAKRIGCSTKHLSLVHSGNARASMELQEKISEYFGVPYYKMVAYGEEILKALKELEPFPCYYEVMSLPRNKRFDKIVEIAKEQVGCSLVVFDSSVKEKYEKGEMTEIEVFENVKKYMEVAKEKIAANFD